MHKDIKQYNKDQGKINTTICNNLAKEIDAGLPKAESKIWHRHPVWFLEGNPVVGYAVRKNDVQLLFWSGQTFEDNLISTGSFKAAEARYTNTKEINIKDLKRWLKKSKTIQWDYKNIVKRKGKLIRI